MDVTTSTRAHKSRRRAQVTSRSGEVCVVALTGVLDLATCPLLASALDWGLEQDNHRTVLNLSGLERIGHAGLGTILTAHLRVADQLDEFVIIPGPDSVRRVIDRIHGSDRAKCRRGVWR
jgi:anti-anti-sigma factor